MKTEIEGLVETETWVLFPKKRHKIISGRLV